MTPRPPHRRAQIIDAAADQFHRLGYHRAGTGDIAAAVGITAGALYKHFPSKQDLLREIILDRLQRFEATFEATSAAPVEDAARAMFAFALTFRDFGVLWQRESRHLPGPERDKLRHQIRELASHLATRIRKTRPELTEFQADLLAWTVFAIGTSPSHSTLELARPRFDHVLATAVQAALTTALPKAPRRITAAARVDRTPLVDRASRREALLDEAVVLFARDGFSSVTMEDIGAAVGIAGPHVYNHFASKTEILDSAITRGTQWLQFLVTQARGTARIARTADEALNTLLRSYIGFALQHSALIDVLLGETHHLPEDRRQAAHQAQHEFLSDWVRLLDNRLGRDNTELRIVIQAALTIVNTVARTQHLTEEPDLADQLVQICASVQTS